MKKLSLLLVPFLLLLAACAPSFNAAKDEVIYNVSFPAELRQVFGPAVTDEMLVSALASVEIQLFYKEAGNTVTAGYSAFTEDQSQRSISRNGLARTVFIAQRRGGSEKIFMTWRVAALGFNHVAVSVKTESDDSSVEKRGLEDQVFNELQNSIYLTRVSSGR